VVVVWSALQAKTLVGVSAGAGPAFSRPVRPQPFFAVTRPASKFVVRQRIPALTGHPMSGPTRFRSPHQSAFIRNHHTPGTLSPQGHFPPGLMVFLTTECQDRSINSLPQLGQYVLAAFDITLPT
jgi:hypothetical protein